MASRQRTDFAPIRQLTCKKCLPPVPCKDCGKEIPRRTGKGGQKRYCGKPCNPPLRKFVGGGCIVIDCQCPARGTHGYCEKHYARLRRTSSLETVIDTAWYHQCQSCGDPTNGRKFCSQRCRTRHDRGIEMKRQCPTCGTFFRYRGRNSCCSSECTALRRRFLAIQSWRRRKAKDPAWWERTKDYSRHRCAMRRAFLKDGCEVFATEEIFNRDCWCCRICGIPVDRALEWPASLSASLDHVLPLSKGGRHTRDNVQLAHLRCNLKKNDKVLNDTRRGE